MLNEIQYWSESGYGVACWQHQFSSITEVKQHVPALVIGWVTVSVIRITTSGPVIIGAASFWYSITGWEESLLMRDGSAPNLRSRPMRGRGNNQGLSSLSYKLSTGLTGGDRFKKAQDGFRVLVVHWMEILVLSFQCSLHSDTIQILKKNIIWFYYS